MVNILTPVALTLWTLCVLWDDFCLYLVLIEKSSWCWIKFVYVYFWMLHSFVLLYLVILNSIPFLSFLYLGVNVMLPVIHFLYCTSIITALSCIQPLPSWVSFMVHLFKRAKIITRWLTEFIAIYVAHIIIHKICLVRASKITFDFHNNNRQNTFVKSKLHIDCGVTVA